MHCYTSTSSYIGIRVENKVKFRSIKKNTEEVDTLPGVLR